MPLYINFKNLKLCKSSKININQHEKRNYIYLFT